MALGLKARIIGCLLGGVLGDAWGGPFEGSRGPVHFSIPERPVLSDDTQLTIATCESIIERSAVDPESVAAHFLRWFVAGRIRGIGSSTLKAMHNLAAGTHWALAGARGEYAAGNGAAMRIAPLAFLLDPANASDCTVISDVCHITHHNDEAYVGALAVVLAIRSVLAGKWSAERSFLNNVIGDLPHSAVRDRAEQLLPLRLSPTEVASCFGATGHVVDTVPLALYCAQFIATQPLQQVLAQAIEAGGDADTIASITGQVAGCVAGDGAVPRERFAPIDGIEEVAGVVEQFAEFLLR